MHKNWWISTGFPDACLYPIEPNLYITSQKVPNDVSLNSDHGSKIAEDLIDVLNKALLMKKLLQTMDQHFIAPSSVTHVSLRHILMTYSPHIRWPWFLSSSACIYFIYLWDINDTSVNRLHTIKLALYLMMNMGIVPCVSRQAIA